MLVSALGQALGVPVAIERREGDHAVWVEGAPTEGQGWQELALERLGRRLGALRWQGDAALADQLTPLVRTIGTLVERDWLDGDGAPRSAQPAMLRAALAGADTFVWEWDIDSDWLGDIQEGLLLLGYEIDEVDHTQQDWNRLIHPDDQPDNEVAFQRHARGETPFYEHAYRARAKSGEWRWMLERGRIVEWHADGRPRRMVGTQTDITERRRIEEKVHEATARLERIAANAPGLMYQYTLDAEGQGHFDFASDRVRDLFGIPPEVATADAGMVYAAIEPEDRAAVDESVRLSAERLTEWRSEFRVRRPDGQIRWLDGRSMPQRRADGSTVWHGTMQDVTELRELQAAREQAAMAAAANRAKTEFLSRMSHELRTPLNAVLGFTQLMEIDQADPPTEGQQRRLRLIRDAGEHLLQMIGDLLDLTRIESGGLALQLGPAPLLPLAQEAVEMVRATAEKAAVSLHLDGPDATARADRVRLRQVMLNLLSNAIKYNRRGGRVDLRVRVAGDGSVVLQVADTGSGIAEADLPRLFDPFYRGAQEGGTVEGAGIGLAVTRSLVSLMGGSISVSSDPGRGATFTVVLAAA